jgi:hypothetical protein
MKEGVGIVALVISFFVGLLVLIGIIWVLSFAFGWFTAAPQGKLQARQQIQSGNYRIAAYESFFNKCSSITTLDEALNQTLDNEKSDKGSDLTRDKVNFTAQLNSRNDAANQYNVDAQKSYTVGQFKASNLPYSIPPYQKGEVFSCVS